MPLQVLRTRLQRTLLSRLPTVPLLSMAQAMQIKPQQRMVKTDYASAWCHSGHDGTYGDYDGYDGSATEHVGNTTALRRRYYGNTSEIRWRWRQMASTYS